MNRSRSPPAGRTSPASSPFEFNFYNIATGWRKGLDGNSYNANALLVKNV
jgi:hypothetical protein